MNLRGTVAACSRLCISHGWSSVAATPPALAAQDLCFVFVFTLELLFRLFIEKGSFISDFANAFDTVLVVLGCLASTRLRGCAKVRLLASVDLAKVGWLGSLEGSASAPWTTFLSCAWSGWLGGSQEAAQFFLRRCNLRY